MTRLVTATCLAAAFAVTLGAQVPPEPQEPPTPPAPQEPVPPAPEEPQVPQAPQPTPQQERQEMEGEEVTLTGCVQAGTEPEAFTLTNVTGGPEMTRAEATTDITYELSAETGVRLQEHVGHKVQVTGTLEEGASAQATARADVPGDPAERATAKAGGDKRLNVTSIQHISPTCP